MNDLHHSQTYTNGILDIHTYLNQWHSEHITHAHCEQHCHQTQVGATELRQLMFVEFLAGAGTLRYEEVPSLERMTAAVTRGLADYNAASRKPMRLVLFLYALEHVARVGRVIRQPAGHALLVGVGGSGRQSLARLAAFILDYQVRDTHC
jgi:hypothetical protein